MAKKAELGHLRFHDLRNTFALLMLQHGGKPKVISECLGHASVGFTMDVYSHIIEDMQKMLWRYPTKYYPLEFFRAITLNKC